ncbi:hypothetical protein [Actinomadura formosensis]|uniref:hypothetical protein n=1 Tax=Actinomadura formosensis TaxID=60706 RepID=UPI00082B14FE|nr:hypothetical protein [Actinomadura formosensis]
MSDDTEAGRLDQHTAERLLDGAGGHAPLHALLTTATAPGRPEELGGEDAAVAAFLAASAPAARKSRLTGLRRFLTAKVIALVGGSILLTGGVAYGTGHFPGQAPEPSPSSRHHEHHHGGGNDNTPATRYSPSPTHRPSSSPSASPTTSRQHDKANASGQPKKSPNPHSTSTPPRGSDNDNGNPPATGPGKGKNETTRPTAKPTQPNNIRRKPQ